MTTARGPSGALARPDWWAGSELSASDLRLEQKYFLQRLRRDRRLVHGWGVVCGLNVVSANDTSLNRGWELLVCPGYGVGPCGDEILVETPFPFNLSDYLWTRPRGQPGESRLDRRRKRPRSGGVRALSAGARRLRLWRRARTNLALYRRSPHRRHLDSVVYTWPWFRCLPRRKSAMSRMPAKLRVAAGGGYSTIAERTDPEPLHRELWSTLICLSRQRG